MGTTGTREPWTPRHFLLDGRIGVRNRRAYVRAAIGTVAWLFGPLLLARLLGRIGQRRAVHTVLRCWARLLAWHLRLTVELGGLEHIEPETAYIVTPLHEGLADAIVLLHLPLDLRFVVRDELFEWPVFGGLLRDTAQVCICPEQGALSYLQLRRQAPAVLAGGESLVVFPRAASSESRPTSKPGRSRSPWPSIARSCPSCSPAVTGSGSIRSRRVCGMASASASGCFRRSSRRHTD